MAVVVDAHGRQHCDFRDAVYKMQVQPCPHWDLRGPRTLLYVLRHLAEHGPTPVGWHERWKSSYQLRDSDDYVDQHLHVCKALHIAVVLDQLQVINVLAFELLGRQLQLLEEKQAEVGGRGGAAGGHEVDEAFLFVNVGPSRALTCVAPELKEWISEELRKEASILKERRKAREERELQRGAPGGGGRRGRGGRGRGGGGGGGGGQADAAGAT